MGPLYWPMRNLDGIIIKTYPTLFIQLQNITTIYSVVTDTLPKKNRKEKLESEMKQLERDIELIESHPVIYIQ